MNLNKQLESFLISDSDLENVGGGKSSKKVKTAEASCLGLGLLAIGFYLAKDIKKFFLK